MLPVPAQLHDIFGLPASAASLIHDHTDGVDVRCHAASRQERDEYILEILELIRSPRIERSVEENRAAWERGWQQNLEEARASGFALEALRPKYFRGNRFLRWQGDVVVSENPQIEYDLFVLARRLLFGSFLPGIRTIYEIGSGSGNNLWLLSELFPEARIIGLDWVAPAVQLATELGRASRRQIEGRHLDMLNPDRAFALDPGAAVVTIHALEQLGDQHLALLDWLAAARPALVLHYEPILEFYDRANVLDYLALWYSQRRRYLTGFWTELAARRDAGRIEVLDARRPRLGGVYHEASVIVWRPTAID
ncbi:MAG: class I SAM-dependent methyltransferase [Acidobacteriota bacterium]